MRMSSFLGAVVASAAASVAVPLHAECGHGRCCCEPNIVVHVCPPKKSDCCAKPRRSSTESAPRGAIVESAPVFGYAMPMMGMVAPFGAVQTSGFGVEMAPVRRTRSTADESAEIDCCKRLQVEVERLNARVDKLTDAVEKQKDAVDKITTYLEQKK